MTSIMGFSKPGLTGLVNKGLLFNILMYTQYVHSVKAKHGS
jgi:hypothetical protein